MADYTVLKNANLAVNLDIAVLLAEASQAAYGRIGPDDPSADDTVDSPAQWAAKTGFDAVNTFDNNNLQGFWCVHDEVALLAFRGTSNPRQWIRDARFFPAPYPWGRLHVGFRNGVNAHTADLRKFMNAAAAGSAAFVWMTGHSLGGALAVISASKLTLLGPPAVVPPRVYTYGQPRVGLSGFAERFKQEFPERLVRFINEDDIVPRVPPIFQHTGLPKHIIRPGVLELAMAENAPALSDEQSERFAALQRACARVPGAVVPESMAEVAPDASPRLIDDEPQALTPQQFADLQYGLGATPAPQEGASAAESVPEGAISIPAFDDHAIGNYIQRLKELAATA